VQVEPLRRRQISVENDYAFLKLSLLLNRISRGIVELEAVDRASRSAFVASEATPV